METGVALAEDVLIEILIKLPVKSLVRFRCVSKYWCALIKSPNFVGWHLKRDCKNECLLQNRGKVLSFHDLDSPDILVSPNVSIPLDFKFCNFLGICNGLVCLAMVETVVLCNPALREFQVLATPSEKINPRGNLPVVSGFGFDVNTNAYKVVRLWRVYLNTPGSDFGMRMDLYNSNTNSWRSIHGVAPLIDYCSSSNAILNGAFHWNAGPSHKYIVSFDLSTEVFQQFDHPNFDDEQIDDEELTSIIVSNQCLCLVRFTNDEQLFHIWVMKEYGVRESWTKQFVIGPYRIRWPFLSLKNEWVVVETHGWEMGYCALHGHEMKIFHFGWENYIPLTVVVFTENLISLKQVIMGRKRD